MMQGNFPVLSSILTLDSYFFQGALKVWKFPLPKIFENEPPNGSFAKLPSNEPVNVLVRVYVVRVSEYIEIIEFSVYLSPLLSV